MSTGSQSKNSKVFAVQRTPPSGQGRIACIDIPNFELQYVERTLELPKGQSHALTDASEASPRVLECNAAAYAAGVSVGMRVTAAKSLCANLHVSISNTEEIEGKRQEIAEHLRKFSPWVERHPLWPNSFWLRGDGLASLWANATQWGEAMHASLALAGWRVFVVVGFSRFFSLAIARQYARELRVFRHADQERDAALRTPLNTLILDKKLQTEFQVLGVRTLADVHDLPSGAVLRRYGAEAARWVQWVRAERSVSSHAVPLQRRYTTRTEWDEAVKRKTTLLFLLQTPLTDVLEQVRRAGLSCGCLEFTLYFDWGRYIDDRLQQRIQRAGVKAHGTLSFVTRAAFAHLELERWTELLRLRLSKVQLPLGVVRVDVEAEAVRAETRQSEWDDAGQARVPDALLEALARVRAEFGDEVVGQLKVGSTHLPEARHQWVECTHLTVPAPHPRWTPTSLRRLMVRTRTSTRDVDETSLVRWVERMCAMSRCVRIQGPYVVAGAWWHTPVERACYYVFLQRGEVLWVYYDRVRKRWFLQGEVF